MTIADFAALALLLSMLIYVLLDGTDLGVGILFLWFREESQRKRMVDRIPVSYTHLTLPTTF